MLKVGRPDQEAVGGGDNQVVAVGGKTHNGLVVGTHGKGDVVVQGIVFRNNLLDKQVSRLDIDSYFLKTGAAGQGVNGLLQPFQAGGHITVKKIPVFVEL